MIPESIRKALVDAGLVGVEDLGEIEAQARDQEEDPQQLLVRRGHCTEEELLRVVGEALGMAFMDDLTALRPSQAFAEAVPRDFSRQHRLAGFEGSNGEILVATSRPMALWAVDEVSCRTGVEVRTVVAREEDVMACINACYEGRGRGLSMALEDLGSLNLDGITKEVVKSEDLMDMATKAPIVRLLNTILSSALPLRATDIHLQPFEEHLRVRYRIDGILYTKMEVPKEIQDAIISRVKIMGKMDIAERRLPQDGGMSFTSAGREVDVRISSVPTQHGERIVMRLQDKSTGLYNLEKLGLLHEDMAAIKGLLRMTHGIILVTGPTGSGKTTTLYSALKHINSPELNIITVEDPVEYLLPGISQIQVSNKRGLTFASGLRSIVRQDPDILMVGEIRDLETLSIAIQSALTGHLVFSTLHTNDAPGAVSRMLDLGAEPYLVNSSVLAVIAQRLVRLVCPACREPRELTGAQMEELRLTTSDVKGKVVYAGRGCSACDQTGYLGRTGIYEMLLIDDVVRDQISRRESASAIKKTAVERGLKTLREDALVKLFKGLTSAEDIVRTTQLDAY
jgi:general secretion pathway protein E